MSARATASLIGLISLQCFALSPCGLLPQPSAVPMPPAVSATGRWETCKPALPPGCGFGAFQITFWPHQCASSGVADYDIYVRMTWIEGTPLLPGQPDANGEFTGLPYVADFPAFLRMRVSHFSSILRLSDGRTTHQLSEEETAVPFDFVGIVDRRIESGLVPGNAAWKFCPTSSRIVFCNGVAGSINAEPIFLTPPLYHSGFESP